MKRTSLAVLVIVAVMGSGFFASSLIAADVPASSPTVTAYYFHGNFRCPTCRNMEQYSREVIENDFKDALASGKLSFKAVNVEQSGNEHFVNDYQLYTKALILSLVKGDKEVRSKNLDKIWEYVRNKQKFQDYVRSEVTAFMQEV
ncbi:MAG TPA: nitrophenyl compound nitroreductase subunit ArsF family protein [Candidatus Omnitrophota bacterium]|nr:nitrophenyl compound nitroreductase subunit ArsF family protein [Candidatus Omnitrophota bacterium]